MARVLSTITRDGVEYWVEIVTKGRTLDENGKDVPKIVGKSATRLVENLEEACEVYGTKVIFEKAMAQIRTDNRNAVRGSSDGGKLKASDVIQMFCDGTLDATVVNENALKWKVDNTTAAERMIVVEPDAERITYSTIKRIDEELEE